MFTWKVIILFYFFIFSRSDNIIKNFYYSNLRIKIRKFIKQILQKERNPESKGELGFMSKKIFNKIFYKINFRKLNYFQINEEIIEEIMKEGNLQNDKTNKSDNLDNSSFKNEISYSNNFFQYEKTETFKKTENIFDNLLSEELQKEKLKNEENDFVLQKYDDCNENDLIICEDRFSFSSSVTDFLVFN